MDLVKCVSNLRLRRIAIAGAMLGAACAFAQPPCVNLGALNYPSTTVNATVNVPAPGAVRWVCFSIPGVDRAACQYLDIAASAGAPALSSNDSEIGLYNGAGNRIADDDDDGPGNYSALSFGLQAPTRPNGTGLAHNGRDGALLPPGVYYLSVSGFNTTFGAAGWAVTTASTAIGNVNLSISLVASTATTPSGSGTAIPSGGLPGTPVNLRVTVAPGNCPPSAGLSVTVDATGIDAGFVPLRDDGIVPDTTAGDNIFNGTAVIGPLAARGSYVLPATITDNQGRTGGATIPVRVLGRPTVFEDIGTLTPGTNTWRCVTLAPGEVKWFRATLPPVADPLNFFDVYSFAGAPPVLSNNDTEIGFFDDLGTRIADDDDDNHNLYSALSFGRVLPNRAAILNGVLFDGRDGPKAGGVYWISLSSFNTSFASNWDVASTSTASGNACIVFNFDTARPIIITDFSPTTARADDVVTINGIGFGNNPDNLCIGVPQPPDGGIPMRALTAAETRMTAQMAGIQPTAVAGPIMVIAGTGSTGTFVPIFDSLIPEDPQGTWAWSSDNGPVGVSQTLLTPDATIPPPPPNGLQEDIFGELVNGRLCFFINGNWPPNRYLRIWLHVRTPQGWVDVFVGCIRLRLPGTSLQCADLICDMIRCSIIQRLNRQVNCFVTPAGPNTAKITVSFKNQFGDFIPILEAGSVLRSFTPNGLSLPTLGNVTPFFGSFITPSPIPGAALVNNIGSSGQDGATVATAPTTAGIEIEMLPLDLAAPGSSMRITGWGSLGGQPGRRLGNARLQLAPDSFFDVFTDFAPIGATQTRVLIHLGDNLVAESIVPSNGLIARILPGPNGMARPRGCGKLPPTRPRPPFPPFPPYPPCYWIPFDRLAQFQLAGGQLVLGDRISLLAAGGGLAINNVVALDVAAGGTNTMTILDSRSFPVPCIADVDDGTGTGTPDGGVGIEDLLYYLGLYDAGSVFADVDDGTGTGTPDGGVGIEDLLFYLERYDAGC